MKVTALIPLLALLALSTNSIGIYSSKEDISQYVSGIRETFNNVYSKIANTYGPENAYVLDNGFHMGKRDFLKAKFINSMIFKKKFIYSFSGTSVTVGGDCYANESYPFVFERIMAESFQSAGIALVVNNIANGNNPIEPYDYCIGARGGMDVDVVSWEQDMMCGRNKKPSVEMFIRNTMLIPSHPAILTTVPGPNVGYAKKAGEMDGRMYGSGIRSSRATYNEYGLHTYSAWEALRGQENNEAFSPKHLYVDGKNFGKAGWHPGPYGHEFIAYCLARGYIHLFDEALTELEKIFDKSSSADNFLENINKFIATSTERPPEIPPSLFCDHPYCIHPFPTCIASFEPRADYDFDLLKYVVNTEVFDYRPDYQSTMTTTNHPTWTMRIHPLMQSSMAKIEKQGSESKKWVLYGNNFNGPIEFKITSKLSNELRVCRLRPGSHGDPPYIASLTSDTKYEIDNKEIPSKDDYMCAVLSMADIPPGDHILRITPRNEKHVAIQAIVWN